ncbi:unnamed protein product [Polarella glacialis]|uniref:Uncharacterized protein n=1 Tax=Polarella glacialis TaxID=89957 RepID=A0A813IWM6_POLGL|nr:unnamed protein product [Polarella glacialis]
MGEGSGDRGEGLDRQSLRAVRKLFQEELNEIKNLLEGLMETQRDILNRIPDRQGGPRVALKIVSTPSRPSNPDAQPRTFSSAAAQHKKNKRPITIDQLEEQLAEHLQAAKCLGPSRVQPSTQCPKSLERAVEGNTTWFRSVTGPSPVVAALACFENAASVWNRSVSASSALACPDPAEPPNLSKGMKRAPTESADALSGVGCRSLLPGQTAPFDSPFGPGRLIKAPTLSAVEEGHQRPESPDSPFVLHPITSSPPEPPGSQQLAMLAKPCRILQEESVSSGELKHQGSVHSMATPVTPLPSIGGSMDRLWAAHDEVRVQRQEADGESGATERVGTGLSCYQRYLSRSSRAVFCIFAILPMRKGRSGYLYPAVVQLALVMIAAYSLISAHSNRERPFLLSWYNPALSCLGIVMALSSLHWKRVQMLLGPTRNPLKTYASFHGFYGHWISSLPFDFLVAIVFLAFEATLRMRPREPECVTNESWSYRLCQAAGALAFAVVMFFKMHVVSCLDLMIDNFSQEYADHKLAQVGVLHWNLLQATMNQAAKTLEGSFVILFGLTFAGLAAVGADVVLGSASELAPDAVSICSGGQLVWVLEPLQLILGRALLLIYVSSRAAGLTEKCVRTRCFVNSLVVPDHCMLDEERSYLVRYIDDSAAGFYIQGVRLTVFAIMKMFYGMCALTFAIVVHASREAHAVD